MLKTKIKWQGIVPEYKNKYRTKEEEKLSPYTIRYLKVIK